MVELAELDEDLSILEPSAGKGCILKKITHYADHSYCERNVSFCYSTLEQYQ